jgi:hypothetical protein
MTYSLLLSEGKAIAEPKSSPDVVQAREHAVIHAIAGGLPYYDPNAGLNELAQTLSSLVRDRDNLFEWHGWPVAAVDGTDPVHPASDNSIVGQDILATAISIDNYLNRTTYDLVMQDQAMRETISRFFPTLLGDVSGNGSVTAYDSSLILLYISGMIDLSVSQRWAADTNGDGSVDGLDAALILRRVAELIERFPVQ